MAQVMTLGSIDRPVGDARPDQQEERVLAQRCLDGDSSAFAVLVRLHGAAVHRFCVRLVGPSVGEEVAQETFARCWTRLGEFRWESSLRSWLFRIALNLCRDHLKSARVRDDAAARSDAEEADPARGPEGEAVGQQTLAVVRRAVERLPAKYREAFVLKHVEDLSYEEMQAIVGLEIGALKVRVHRARNMLKALLLEEESRS